ncbi:transcriptional regulator (GntR family protein) [Desulforapulum autotrophicum HRM2]|uniref:Transcriptional regulator (GntR family protein) n=1 Tax=Desulforapulum autotrophicum (strain ATCC 43914 / DSM 3382 / VKM B-1955 / HRM2) TaxID=177437 RepID=C0QJS8_DESAH|nr:transcriptional regulator (GntR family protein) [Desulforapulum autotrophicum HRM2]
MRHIADNNGSVSDQAPLEKAFHDLLFSRIDNDLLVEFCHRSCQGISKFLFYRHWVKLFSAQKVYERHKEIVDGLKTKDPLRAMETFYNKLLSKHHCESLDFRALFGFPDRNIVNQRG